MVEKQAKLWGGPVSFMLWVPDQSQLSDALARAKDMHERVGGSCQMDVGVVIGVPQWEGDDVNVEYDRAFPANALRNAAVAQARTDLVAIVDADLIPSPGWCL